MANLSRLALAKSVCTTLAKKALEVPQCSHRTITHILQLNWISGHSQSITKTKITIFRTSSSYSKKTQAKSWLSKAKTMASSLSRLMDQLIARWTKISCMSNRSPIQTSWHTNIASQTRATTPSVSSTALITTPWSTTMTSEPPKAHCRRWQTRSGPKTTDMLMTFLLTTPCYHTKMTWTGLMARMTTVREKTTLRMRSSKMYRTICNSRNLKHTSQTSPRVQWAAMTWRVCSLVPRIKGMQIKLTTMELCHRAIWQLPRHHHRLKSRKYQPSTSTTEQSSIGPSQLITRPSCRSSRALTTSTKWLSLVME